MKLGSQEHKTQYCQDLLKAYHENIWNDEIYRSRLETLAGQQQAGLAKIKFAIENKEFKSKNEGDKAKFVQERELQATETKIADLTEKITNTWPMRIQEIESYMDQ